MKIARDLNLVQSIETDLGTIHVHSAPLSREVWENYFLVLAKTYAAIFSEGLTIVAGPGMANLLLKRIAMASGVWAGASGVEQGLLPEIRRLTNVVVPSGSGWQTMPYEELLRGDLLDKEDVSSVEAAIVFFTCASAVLRGRQNRSKLEILTGGLRNAWGASSTSSDVMAFAASLPTLTPAETTGASRPAASSVPH